MGKFGRYNHTKFRDQIYPSVKIRVRETDLYMTYTDEEKLESVAHRVYNDPHYWWIILLANPEYVTEYDIEPGEIIRIPMPLNSAINEIRSQTK